MTTQTTPSAQAKMLAEKFCNGMFVGHADLYRDDLAKFIEEIMQSVYDAKEFYDAGQPN